MKRLSLLIVVLLSVIFATAQQRSCGTMQHLESLYHKDSNLEQRMQTNELKIAKWIKNNPTNSNKSSTIITIPVVVHVVWNTNSENISDNQVLSQITILNEDFRRLNADASNTPTAFQSVAADSEIEFCLATIDPDGNSTTGITRTQTSQSSFSTNDGVKFSSSGGINAWNTSQYMNIWVCDLGNSLLGYAQFPGGSNSTDGVVCHYSYFGNTGTATYPYNQGRTATHEVGHYLNLRHIWGDSNCGNDYCNDTPTQQASNGGCPNFPSTSNCSGNGANGDMYMNYMDYTYDGCMNMFTQDQKTRMLAAINTSRSGLLNNSVCSGNVDVYGCTDLLANNYNSNATVNDGSCCYDDLLTISITTDDYPAETSWSLFDQNGNIVESVSPGILTQANTTYEWEVCIDPSLCYDFIIFDEYGDGICCDYGNGSFFLEYLGSTIANGSSFYSSETIASIGPGCTTPILGCIDPLACNYDNTATLDDGSCILPDGCTDLLANNYDSSALCDDGSCSYSSYGCTDPLAGNYDPGATIDDGSCCYDQITIDIQTDNYPDETSWSLIDQNGNVVANISSGTLTSPNSNYTWDICVNASECYYFTISDTYGDGVCCLEGNGSYSILYNGTLISSGGDFNYFERISIGCVVGCMNNNYLNYNPNATTNTAYGGILDPNIGTGGYFNGNQYLIFDTYVESNIVSAVIYALASNTITFELRDNNATVIDDTTIAVIQGGQRLYFDFDVPVGNNYQLGVSSNNSGLYRNNGGVSYPYDIGGLISISGSSANTAGFYYFYYDIEVEAVCESVVSLVYGCTDPNACNYDATANTDDGSCNTVYGCTDPTQFNYDANATCDDGSCQPFTYGCTDPTADNYNSTVNTDDGNCIWLGCTDATADNYDATATVDDGTCSYTTVSGCTDPTADNYDATATVDDGSCTYTVSGCTDATADNYDPTATVDDGSCTYPTVCTSPKPTGLYAFDIIDTKVKIGWDNMNSSTCMVLKYFVRYREVGATAWITKSAGVGNGLCQFGLNTTEKWLPNLTASTTYEFKMKAFYCGGTESNYSPTAQFTTADPCPDMINLAVQTFNSNAEKAKFTWDTTGVYVFARVSLRVDTSGAAWQTVGGFGINWPTFSQNKFGLTPGESYRAQGRTFCDNSITAYRSATWTSPIFWTQPSAARIDLGTAIANLDIYPNPSRDVFKISFTSETVQDLKVRVLNVIGEAIISEDLDQFVGEYTKQINLKENAKGVYFLEITTNNGVVNKKLILQ